MGPPEFVEKVTSSTRAVDFPGNLSFFVPYLRYHIKEALEIGGEVLVSRTPDGVISGVFVYDDCERTGTIYTRSRQAFDYFYGLRKFDTIFAEFKTRRENEIYDIYSVDLDGLALDHKFSHGIAVADERNASEVEQFMAATHPGTNRKWAKVGFRNAERCLVIRLGDGIAAAGWVSLVNGIGRLHSLFVRPQYRGMGMGEDIMFARLLWLKSRRARSAFSEISRDNHSSSRIAMKGQMKVIGQVYGYSGDSRRRSR